MLAAVVLLAATAANIHAQLNYKERIHLAFKPQIALASMFDGGRKIVVDNGPGDTQHIWDASAKGADVILGSEVSLWNKAIDLSPQVFVPLKQGADRLAVGSVRIDSPPGETAYEIDITSLVLSSEIQWPTRHGLQAQRLTADPHFKWASEALYAFVLRRHQSDAFPQNAPPATKFCIEILVDQKARVLADTNQKWLAPVMKGLDMNPSEEGISSIETGVLVAKELQYEVVQEHNKFIQERIDELQKNNNPSTAGKRKLKVTLVDAQHLLPKDSDGTSDPYVLLELREQTRSGIAKQPAKSKTARNELNPSWSEDFSFDAPYLDDRYKKYTLAVKVRDQDFGGLMGSAGDDECGEINIDFFHPHGSAHQTLYHDHNEEEEKQEMKDTWVFTEGTDLSTEQLGLLKAGYAVEQEFILKDSTGQDIYHTNGIIGAGEASVIRLRFQWTAEQKQTPTKSKSIFSWGSSDKEKAPLSVEEQVVRLMQQKREAWEVPVVVRLLAGESDVINADVSTTYTLTDRVAITDQDIYLFIAAQEHHEILVNGEATALRQLTRFRQNIGFPLFSQINGGLDIVLVKADDLKPGKMKIPEEVDPYVQFTLHRGGADGDMGAGLSVEHHTSTVRRGNLNPEWGSTLCVTVYRCTDLANADEDVGSRSDPFVVCTLVSEERKVIATAKTRVKSNTLNPEWHGDEGQLRLSTTGGWKVGGGRRGLRDISKCAVLIEVFDHDPTGNEHLGQVWMPLTEYVQHAAGSGMLTVHLKDQAMTSGMTGASGSDSMIQFALKWDEGGERFSFQPDNLSGMYLTMTVKDKNDDPNAFIGKCHEPLDELFMTSAFQHDRDLHGFLTLRPRLESSSGLSGFIEVKVRWKTGVSALKYGQRGSIVTVPWKQTQLTVQSEVWSGPAQQEPFQHLIAPDLPDEVALAQAAADKRQLNKPLSDLYSNAACVGGMQTVRSEVPFKLVREWDDAMGDDDNNLYEFWIRMDWNFTGGAIGLVGADFDGWDASMAGQKDAYCISWDGTSYNNGEGDYEPSEDTVNYTEDHFKASAETRMEYTQGDIENWNSTFKSGDLIVVNVVMASRQRSAELGCHAVFFKKGQREPLCVLKNLPENVYPAVSLCDGTGSMATFGVTKYKAPPGLVRGAVDQEYKFELKRRLQDFYEYFNPRPVNDNQLGQQWENACQGVCEASGYDEGMINSMLRRTYGTDLRMYRLGADDRELVAYTYSNKLTGFGLRGTYDVEVEGAGQRMSGLDASQLESKTRLVRRSWKMFVEDEKVLVDSSMGGKVAGRVVKCRHPADRSKNANKDEQFGQVAKVLRGQAPLMDPYTKDSHRVAKLKLQVLRVDGLSQGLSSMSYSLHMTWCGQSLPTGQPMQTGVSQSSSLKWSDYFVELSLSQLATTNHNSPLLSFDMHLRGEENVGRAKVWFDGQTGNENVLLADTRVISVSNHDSAMIRKHEIAEKKKLLERRPGKADDAGFVLDGDTLLFMDKQAEEQKPRHVVPAEDRWKLNDLNDTGLGWAGHPRTGMLLPRSYGLCEMLASQHKMHTLLLYTGSSERQQVTTITFKLTMEF